MKKNLIIIKYVDFVIGLSNFYAVGMYSYGCDFQGDWNRDVMAYLLSLGAKYKRSGMFVKLSLSNCNFIFCY